MYNDLIIIKQLPIIEEKLKILSDEIRQKVAEALAQECTEDTVKAVKKIRSELNGEFLGFEARRKEIKEQIFAPYEAFNEKYKQYIADNYTQADKQLAERITTIENGLKYKKKEEISEYFCEYASAKLLDFLNVSDAKLNITLSASTKSLKEQAKAFIDKVYGDVETIDTLEDRDEILVEYKRTYNLSEAMLTVKRRREAIEAEKEQAERTKSAKKRFDESAKRVEEAIPPLAPPTAVEDDAVRTLAFKVTAPLSKLKKLKQYLVEGGYEVE